MRVLVSGSHGFIGGHLTAALGGSGHTVIPLVRGLPQKGEAAWDLEHMTIDTSALDASGHAGLEPLDAAIHLAGEPIRPRRLSQRYLRQLTVSRVDSGRLLSVLLTHLKTPPAVYLSGSAVGFYGNRGDEVLTEGSGRGAGFLAELCEQWEESSSAAAHAGIRVVLLRTGIVLGHGGFLATQLPLFRNNLGARLGSGQQWLSWISIADEVGLIMHALQDTSLSGPLNCTAPEPVRNAEFTRTLADLLHRKALLRIPERPARIALGAAADELLFASQRALPQAATESGYQFQYKDIKRALQAVLAD